MMRFTFEACVGRSLDDAWVLARRFETLRGDDTRTDWDRCESWIGRVIAGRLHMLWATRAHLGDLAAGPSGDACAIVERELASGLLREVSGPSLSRCIGGDPLLRQGNAVNATS